MKISVLHAARGRPKQCIQSKERMLSAASNPDAVEYIFAVDDDDPEVLDSTKDHCRVVVDTSIGLKGGNRAYNLAAQASHGDLLVLTADDIVFPKDWDTKLSAQFSGRINESLGIFLGFNGPMHCSVGVQCLTRPWYKELGYVFHPEYPTVYSDVDLYWEARQAGKLVEVHGFGVAHNHPAFDKSVQWDETYLHENSKVNYRIGVEIMNRRWPGALEQIAKEVRPLATITVLHASRGRPEQCLKTRERVLAMAARPASVEYILTIDEDDTATVEATEGLPRVVVGTEGMRGPARAQNAGAKASTGDLIMLIADDNELCDRWDEKLRQAIAGRAKEDFLLMVGYDKPKHFATGVAVLTRTRYNKLGYVNCPEYGNLYSDYDLYWQARSEGKLLEAQGFKFRHLHPLNHPEVKWDETYRKQNAPENYKRDAEVFNRRWPGALEKLMLEMSQSEQSSTKQVYFCFLPERCIYDMSFDVAMSIMHRATKQGFLPLKVRYMRTDVARNAVCLRFLEHSKNPTDTLVMLDIDHDHPHDIIEHLAGRNLPVVVPLMFMRGEPYSCCAFRRDEKGGIHSIAEFPDNVEYVEVGGVGSGAIAIQRQALLALREKGHRYFFQYEYLPDGRTPSEDLYFSKICHEAGVKMYVDMQIETPHIALGLVDLSTHLEYAADHPTGVSAEKMRVSMKGNGKNEDMVNRSGEQPAVQR